MKERLVVILIVAMISLEMKLSYGQYQAPINQSVSIDKVAALTDTLKAIKETTTDPWLRLNCESILRVINSKQLTTLEAGYLANMYDAFVDYLDPYNPSNAETYTGRHRPLILSWVSPSDGSVSFSWLKVPRNWSPGVKYPIYVELHGLWTVASHAFHYMTYPFTTGPTYNNAFEDGFHLSPWGRGNLWYQGNSETDIWECVAALEEIAETDSSRKYLCGHSMGGYGAMIIAGNSPGAWAAVGIYAGALVYAPSALSPSIIDALKDVPVYFVCGTRDDLYAVNQKAYSLLVDAGNKNIHFTSFDGGHSYRQGDVFAMYMWMRKYVNDNVVTVENGQPIEDFHYTNPVQTVMNIQFAGIPYSETQFYIFDLSGRLIRFELNPAVSDNSMLSINTSNLEPGTYIFKLLQASKQVSGIFVKQ